MDEVTFWRDRSVFVTGGTGFLGSHLVRRLVENGARVVCLARGTRSRPDLVSTDRVEVAWGDATNVDRLHHVLRARQVDAVFHLAAQPIVGDARQNPFATMESNVRGTYALLEAARLWGEARTVVVCTSDKVYSPETSPPYREDALLGGHLPYEASKVAADVVARSYAWTYGVPVGVARMGNLYGPGDLQWSRIVPGTIRTLLRGERPVIRSDGTPRRDYFYVEDAAGALLALGEGVFSGRVPCGEAVNFGTGVPTSVLDVVEKLVERSGRDLRPEVLGDGSMGEIVDQWLNCAKAKWLLDWTAKTSLDDGLVETWSWYARHFG